MNTAHYKKYLILGSIADQSFGVGESHVTRSGAIALIVGNDFHFSMLEHCHARVRCTKIDADCRSLCHFSSTSQKQSPDIFARARKCTTCSHNKHVRHNATQRTHIIHITKTQNSFKTLHGNTTTYLLVFGERKTKDKTTCTQQKMSHKNQRTRRSHDHTPTVRHTLLL